MKKQISLLLVLMMMLSAVSCGETPVQESETDVPTVSETDEIILETEPQNPRMLIDDELPEETFDGKDYIVYAPESGQFIAVEGVTGEIVNDTVYNRNLAINERFDVNIVHLSTAGDNSFFMKTVQSGIQEFNVAAYHVVTMSGLVYQNMMLNWYDVDYIDFEKPWWYESTIEDLTINDTCFMPVGDFHPTITAATYAVYYDKTEGEKYSEITGNVYDIVREGKWTYDTVKTISAQVYVDKDGNGKKDENDFFGFAADRLSQANAFFWAFGGKIFERNAEGELKDVYYNEHTVEIVDAISNFLVQSDGVYSTRKEHGAGFILFKQFGSLFAVETIGAARSLGDHENVFGIIPLPKLNEAQENYYTMADGYHPGLAFPKTLEDVEFTGIITEAIAAENYKTVMPAFFDVCLKTRYADSPDDAEMIDLAVESCVFDFGYIYDNWEGYSFFPQTHLANKKPITSLYESSKNAAQNHYGKVFEAFGVDYDY